MSVITAVEKAKQVLNENFILEPPIDVYELARNNGIEIIEQLFPNNYKNVSGFINIEDDHPVMYVNANDSQNRRKFTVAHELGHWILHEILIREDPKKAVLLRVALGANTDILEKEANAFAAELLVPMDIFSKLKNNKSVKQLAELFQVSTDVIGYREITLRNATNSK